MGVVLPTLARLVVLLCVVQDISVWASCKEDVAVILQCSEAWLARKRIMTKHGRREASIDSVAIKRSLGKRQT